MSRSQRCAPLQCQEFETHGEEAWSLRIALQLCRSADGLNARQTRVNLLPVDRALLRIFPVPRLPRSPAPVSLSSCLSPSLQCSRSRSLSAEALLRALSRGCQGPRPELRLPANDLTGIGRYRPGISVNLGPHSLRARRNPVPAAVGLAEVGRSGGMAGEHDVPSPRSRASRPASSLASAHSPVSPHAAGQQQPVRMDGLIKVCSELVNGMMHRLLPESEPSWQCIDRADAVAGVRSKGE